jgi:hypothetical protein
VLSVKCGFALLFNDLEPLFSQKKTTRYHFNPHVCGYFWKRSFFRQPKTEVFKNALQSGVSRKCRFRVYVRTGEKGGFQNRWRFDWLKSMASFRKSHITKQWACSTLAAIIFPEFPPFLRWRVDGRKRVEYITRNLRFLKYRYPHTRKHAYQYKNTSAYRMLSPDGLKMISRKRVYTYSRC